MTLFIWPRSKIINLIRSFPIKKNNSEIEYEFQKGVGQNQKQINACVAPIPW